MKTKSTLVNDLLNLKKHPELLKKFEGGTLQHEAGKVTVEFKAPVTNNLSNDAHDILVKNGLNPNDWEVASFRTSEWTMANGTDGLSVRYTFSRRSNVVDFEDFDVMARIAQAAQAIDTASLEPVGTHGLVLALGDQQYGKLENGSPEEQINRAISIIDQAAAEAEYGMYDEIAVFWLGDHVEGFQSQGGKNIFRTPMGLTQQIAIIRAEMMYAMVKFAKLGVPLKLIAIPGNHGEAHRVAGSGITLYTDNFDTDALLAVRQAALLNEEAFGHVEFFVPSNDEVSVAVSISNTLIGAVHGHQFGPGKGYEWWQKQAFSENPVRDAHILLNGHYHHLRVESSSGRTIVQVPALEKTSTWWRHKTGLTGDPGAVLMQVSDGTVHNIQLLKPAKES